MQNTTYTRIHDNRRGITLLFVVSMIVLFLLMGTTFVVISNDYLTAARKRGKFRLQGDRGPVVLQRALFDLIRGPSLQNTMSPLRGQSLLADQYGYGFRGYVERIEAVTGSGNQLFDILLKDSVGTVGNLERILNDGINITTPITNITNDVDHYFTGQVLSFVSGPAKGSSVRIFSYKVVGTEHRFRVYSDGSENAGIRRVAVANEPSRVIINGRPFSGFGAGYNRDYDPTMGGNPITVEALRPNWRSLEDFGMTDPVLNNFADGFYDRYATVNNSVNEPYDTFSYGDMFLGGFGDHDGNSGTTDVAIPSFHRPNLATIPANAGVPEGRYSFRPVYMDVDGDNFPDPGSTASINFPNVTQPFANRPLDVDNTGNGVLDSIWMDIGIPFQSNSEGRRIKPLVAVMIQDLDGRFNVNAHGNLVDVDPDQLMTRLPMLGGAMGPRGAGLGPAEVSLSDLFPNTIPAGNYSPLLTGGTINGIAYEGRYGANVVPGDPGRENWSFVKFVGYPDTQANATWGLATPNSFNGFVGGLFTSEAVDLFGRYTYGFQQQLDPVFTVPVGIPVVDVDTNSRPNPDIFDSPYEINLLETTQSSNDNLFSAIELERVLRPAERDSLTLPSRLYDFLLDADPTLAARDIITTHSFEVSRTPQVLDVVIVLGNFRYQWKTIPELLYRRLVEVGGLTPAVARTELADMLAPEVLRGMPMNVNQLFGDGLDNDGDDVFDEHFRDDPASPSAVINEARSDQVFDLANNTTINRDHDNDGFSGFDNDPITMEPENDYLSRQIFARQLYVLTWLAAGQAQNTFPAVTLPPDMNNDGMHNNDDIDALAQWCINVVDFRDPDAINTVFEYDRNPFDGWDVDGELSSVESPVGGYRGVVWGAERPELQLTEAIATHDRKSEDLPNGGGTVSGGNDSDYDSDAVPTASCFVELYAPHLTSFNSQKMHAEVYDNINGGIDLARSASTTDSVPIWRMAFTKEQGQDPMGSGGRRVYFVKPSDSVSVGMPVEDGANENFYFPDSSIPIDNINPNDPTRNYAVIGSGGIEVNDKYRTTFGRRTNAFVDHATMHAGTDLKINRTRQIRLVPGDGFEIQDGDITTAEPLRECVAIPLNRSGHVSLPGFMTDADGYAIRSFGLSDPAVGYVDALQGVAPGITAAPMSPIGGIPGGDCYIFDQVLAQPADVLTNHDLLLFDDGTHGNYRWVALQRLANPQAPYDPVENPYLTVDEKPIDLVVFNGSEPGDEPGLPAAPDDVPTEFKTVERGETDQPPGGSLPARERRLLWKPEWSSESPTMENAGIPVIDHFFDHQFIETLGEMNETYSDTMGMAFVDIAWPALSWNNRPFVSQYELALVPGGSGQQLYGPHRPGVVRVGVNDPLVDVPYLSTFEIMQNFSLPGGTYDPATSSRHLLPFRDATNSLARVFDFLEVPSRFIGTEMDFNANNFQGWEVTNELAGINAPYHTVSRRRNPGKININTVLNEEVWNGLIGDYATPGIVPDPMTYGELVASRRGTAATTVTDFDVPFRPVDFGRFAPPGIQKFTTPVAQYEATVQRSGDGMPGNPRLFEYENPASFNDTSRSAVFAESAMSRIGNIATIRSSVFAIWITVGYFEVDNNGLLGAEVGFDENSITRHRGFFIYDRSIPVAFEPGNNHNVERGILVQSYFE